jgi:hypothetical protein
MEPVYRGGLETSGATWISGKIRASCNCQPHYGACVHRSKHNKWKEDEKYIPNQLVKGEIEPVLTFLFGS